MASPTAPLGTATTYSLNVGVKLNVENVIWTITPFDVPLQGTMGSDGRTALSSDTCFEKKIEWLDEVLLVPSSNLGGAMTAGDTFITVTSTAANAGSNNFQIGDVLLIDSEYMLVTGYGTTSPTTQLVVTKAFNGSASAAHSSGAIVKGVGQAMPEGSDPPQARAQDRLNRFNYTQIFGPTAVQVSGTENSVQKYGLTSTEFDKQVANRIKEAFIGVEQALLYGGTPSDTANYRTMGGFVNYITTNVDSATTTLSESALLAKLQDCFDAGGSPDRIVVGSKQKQVLSSIAGPTGAVAANNAIRYAQDTNIRGQVVDYYDSDFGRAMICLDRWCRPSDLFMFSRDQATIATLRPLTFEMLAKTGDSTKGIVVGEKSLWFRKQTHAARFSALT